MNKIIKLMLFIIICSIGLGTESFGMVIENFEDGDITNNPTWVETSIDGSYSVVTGNAYNGSYSLRTNNDGNNDANFEDIAYQNFNVSEFEDGDILSIFVKHDVGTDYSSGGFLGTLGSTRIWNAIGSFYVTTDQTSSTNTGINAIADVWYEYRFVLDFANNEVDLYIINADTNTILYSSTDRDTILDYNTIVLKDRDKTDSNSDYIYWDYITYSKFEEFKIPKLEFTNTTVNNKTFINNSFFNTTNLNFDIEINSTYTNNNINLTYFLYQNNSLIDNNTYNYNSINENTTFYNFSLNLLEEKYNISFKAENNETNITTSNYTLIVDTTPPVINNNIPTEINSYTFNPNSTCEHIDGGYCNISINGQNVALNTTSITLTNNGNITYNITAEDLAGNTIIENGIIFVNPVQYYNIYDNVRDIELENYTFGNYSDINGTIQIPLYNLGLGNHTLEFKKDGYVTDYFLISFNRTSRINQTFNVTPVTLTIKAYDENSPSTQLEVNISINNGTNYTQYNGQEDFEKYYNETLHGNITITIEKAGYGSRKIFTELTPYSVVSHEVYLLTEELTTPVIFQTQNIAQTITIEDVAFTFKKEIEGEPTFLGQAKTDSQGYTYFNMDVLGDYEITISKDGYVTQQINSIPGKTDYTILMEESGIGGSFLYDDFSYKILPIKDTVSSTPFNVSAEVFDELSLISSMRFTVTGTNTSFTDVLTSSNGGKIEFLIENRSARYILNLTVKREGQTHTYIKKIDYKSTTSKNSSISNVAQELDGKENNSSRAFVILITYVSAVVLGSLFSPAIGAVFGLIPITIFAIPAVDWLTPGVAAVFYVFTILGGLYFER